jgi:hypothetical protein
MRLIATFLVAHCAYVALLHIVHIVVRGFFVGLYPLAAVERKPPSQAMEECFPKDCLLGDQLQLSEDIEPCKEIRPVTQPTISN